MHIAVLGMGCAKCEQLYKDVLAVVEREHIDAEVEHIKDVKRIAECGVLTTPALMIDNKVVSSGKALSQSVILMYIKDNISK